MLLIIIMFRCFKCIIRPCHVMSLHNQQHVFHPSTSTLHISLHRADFRYSCHALFGPFYWVSPWRTSRKMTGWCIQKPPDQIKSSVFLLMGITGRRWAGHGWHPRVIAGSWSLENRHVFLSSLRELCLSLAITVCHATECCGHTLSSHASFHSGHHGTTLSYILNTSKGKHVILLFSHTAKKAPLPLRDLYSSSANRSAQPSPSFIFLSICLPLFRPCHLSACWLRISQ